VQAGTEQFGGSTPCPINTNSRAGAKLSAIPNPLPLEKGGKSTVPEITSVAKVTALVVIVPDPLVMGSHGVPKMQVTLLVATARVGDRSKRMIKRFIFAPSAVTFALSLVTSVDSAREDFARGFPRR
jgi:hypothetical protein